MPYASRSIQQGVSGWPPVKSGCHQSDYLFYARAFGTELSDIDLDLSAASQPDVVSRLIQDCLFDKQGQRFDMDGIWQWTVKRRLQGVLAIASATFGNRLNLTSHCTQSGCGEQLEIELQLQDFIDADDTLTICCEPAPDVWLELRLPTGQDQWQWQQYAIEQGSSTLLQHMCRTLIVQCNNKPLTAESQFAQEWLEQIDDTLEAADALTALTLSAQCPVCESTNEIPLDIETRLLSLLATRQQHLLEHIHLIASVYHWSEQEVMQLPVARRNFYVGRITRGTGI